jgi:transcriptional regulator with XRE-family HTH domain
MDRRETVAVFRTRLVEVINRRGLSRAAFAARVGIDRSTLSQLLSPANDRLPRAETIAAIAAREAVSVDWLLGLSQEDKLGTNIVTESLEIAAGGSSPADERLIQWHAEAVGYKIRYIPTDLPDLLKTEDVIGFEFEERGGEVRDTQIGQKEARLAYSRRPESDIEACTSFQAVESFARGEGIWQALSLDSRINQLEYMIPLVDELYPTFRWFLFDGRRRYAPPYTVFGPKRAAIYMGNMYFVFNSTEHIRVLTRHFDDLIRDAVVQPPDVKIHLGKLLTELSGEGSPGGAKEVVR